MPGAGRVAAAFSGLLAAAAALGVAELVAGIAGRATASPLVAVGAAFIDLTPVWLKEWAIRRFGANDKMVLLAGLGAGVTVAALATGLVSRRRPWWGAAALASLAGVAVAAAATRPAAGPVDPVPALVGGAVGVAALVMLVGVASVGAGPRRRSRAAATAGGPRQVRQAHHVALGEGGRDGAGHPIAGGRRGFLLAGTLVALATASGAGGRVLLSRRKVTAARSQVRLPAPVRTAPPVPPGAQVRVAGMPSFRTPNAGFYRVDTALVLPQVHPDDWRLRVHGMVDRPVDLTFADLLALPMVERDITLACVSNEVGGNLAGNARWLGTPLAELLRRAGVRADADQILSTSADGMTLATPLAAVLDGRDALLAVGMNGEALPIAHGFPARMVVPGLYGYVSATKWVVDLKVTRFALDRAYWTRRGYATDAPIKTFSRIDVPKPLARLEHGRVAVAGTAWAQHRGIDAVEWQVDDGPWRQAQLAPVPGLDTWRQWVAEWNAAPGNHTLRVRATDATGATQPEARARPYPDGATGWHSVVVTVT